MRDEYGRGVVGTEENERGIGCSADLSLGLSGMATKMEAGAQAGML